MHGMMHDSLERTDFNTKIIMCGWASWFPINKRATKTGDERQMGQVPAAPIFLALCFVAPFIIRYKHTQKVKSATSNLLYSGAGVSEQWFIRVE